MQRYAIDLRSITQGRGFYTMKLSHYEPVPSHVADSIIAQAKREAEPRTNKSQEAGFRPAWVWRET
jgi:translation elongation factor EF-G